MKIAVAALLISMSVPVAAAGPRHHSPPQPLNLRTDPPQLPLKGKGFTIPMVDYVAADGSIKRNRGVIASTELGPATVGIGFFETTPKQRSPYADPFKSERKKKRAALGVSIPF